MAKSTIGEAELAEIVAMDWEAGYFLLGWSWLWFVPACIAAFAGMVLAWVNEPAVVWAGVAYVGALLFVGAIRLRAAYFRLRRMVQFLLKLCDEPGHDPVSRECMVKNIQRWRTLGRRAKAAIARRNARRKRLASYVALFGAFCSVASGWPTFTNQSISMLAMIAQGISVLVMLSALSVYGCICIVEARRIEKFIRSAVANRSPATEKE